MARTLGLLLAAAAVTVSLAAYTTAYLLVLVALLGGWVQRAWGDPSRDESVKFAQEPMVLTTIEGKEYYGHAEESTAWA